MGEPLEHKDCREQGQKIADEIDAGVVDVTAADPGDPTIESMRCPHGVRYWLVPVDGPS